MLYKSVFVCYIEVMCGRHEERLIDEIFKSRSYQKLARPVVKESEAVNVVFGLSLQQIIKVVSQSVCLSVQFYCVLIDVLSSCVFYL